MKIEEREQLIRKVTEIGNGAHIFAPKEWIDEKVLIIRLEKKSIKEEIIEILYPYLDKIIAVLIYGSHARKEAFENSDIDVLIIAKEKFKIERKNRFDFIILSEDFLPSAIEKNPILMYSIFREAEAIINSSYLEKLKKTKIDPGVFEIFVNSTEESVKSSEEILELDKKTGKTASNSLLYSLILRLRGIFIINRLLKNQEYSNRTFKEWITNNCKVSYDKIYRIYRGIRDDINIKEKRPIEEAEILLKLLKQEIKKIKKKIW